MNKNEYRSFDDLPLMLSVPEVASVRGSVGPEHTSW